jgi:hypothetical protein
LIKQRKHKVNIIYMYNRTRRIALHFINEWNHNILFMEITILLSLRKKWHITRLLDLTALTAEIPPALKVPAIVAAWPIGKVLNVLCDLVVYLLSPRRYPFEVVKKLGLNLLVIRCYPLHRFWQGKVEVSHDDCDNVMTIISGGLFLVIGSNVLLRPCKSLSTHSSRTQLTLSKMMRSAMRYSSSLMTEW